VDARAPSRAGDRTITLGRSPALPTPVVLGSPGTGIGQACEVERRRVGDPCALLVVLPRIVLRACATLGTGRPASQQRLVAQRYEAADRRAPAVATGLG
jgi:hypothetical protein